MHANGVVGFGRVALVVAVSALALAACSQEASDETGEAAAPAATEAPAAVPTVAATVAPDNTDTIKGEKFAEFTGDAAKGATDFLPCKTCHAIEEGVNKIGPSLHKIVGRSAGAVDKFSYSPANANSGITWTPEKLFQYLEAPQRVVPGTKMSYAGMSDPQKRANVIVYLQTN